MKEKNVQHEAEVLHQKKLALENIKAQEEERKRIAVMIHDDIGTGSISYPYGSIIWIPKVMN